MKLVIIEEKAYIMRICVVLCVIFGCLKDEALAITCPSTPTGPL